MGAKTLISPEEYLAMSFEGATPDYVDGELVERHVGRTSHADTQYCLAVVFVDLRRHRRAFPLTEQTLIIAPRRHRVADFCVFIDKPEEFPSVPPLVVAEILSADDRMSEVLEKLEEYRRFGVTHIWLLDPLAKRMYLYEDGGLRNVSEYHLPEFDLTIRPDQIFQLGHVS